jgi:hypothetical protein
MKIEQISRSGRGLHRYLFNRNDAENIQFQSMPAKADWKADTAKIHQNLSVQTRD